MDQKSDADIRRVSTALCDEWDKTFNHEDPESFDRLAHVAIRAMTLKKSREALITCAEALFLARPVVEAYAKQSAIFFDSNRKRPNSEQAKKALNLLDTAAEAAREALSRHD